MVALLWTILGVFTVTGFSIVGACTAISISQNHVNE